MDSRAIVRYGVRGIRVGDDDCKKYLKLSNNLLVHLLKCVSRFGILELELFEGQYHREVEER